VAGRDEEADGGEAESILVIVRLRPGEDRVRAVAGLTDGLTKGVPEAGWRVTPAGGADTAGEFAPAPGETMVKIVVPDLDVLEDTASAVCRALAPLTGVADVRRPAAITPAGHRFLTDRQRCAVRGVEADDVNAALRMAHAGECVAQPADAPRPALTLRWPARYCLGSPEMMNLPVPGRGSWCRLQDCVIDRRGRGDEAGDPGPAARGASAIYRQQGRRFAPVTFRTPGGADALRRAREAVYPLIPAGCETVWQSR
jgi:hypothetical protein